VGNAGIGLRWWPALVVVLVVVAGLLAALWFGQRRLIYFPDSTSPRLPADAREVSFETSDGLRLAAWVVAPASTDRGLAVLVAPGNGGNRAGRIGLARDLAKAGLTVLLMDYRGYGGNPGRPSEDGLARDARAAEAYLASVGVGLERTVYFGESLGAAVVSELATEYPPAGLVLRSPFLDLASVGAHHYPFLPVRALLRDRYPVAENVARVRVPTVVIYGSADTVVPAEQSQAVAQQSAGLVNAVVVAGADHNDAALVGGPLVIGAVVDLVRRIGER
jgi:alpha-beta hydrolase superfamily lysophospholipase